MKFFKHNTTLFTIFILLILLVGGILMKKNVLSVDPVVSLPVNRTCYLYEGEAPKASPEDADASVDREYIELNINKDSVVNGIHYILPTENAVNKADFIGVTQDGYFNTIATAHSQGVTWKEQRLYKVIGDKLFIGYQEVDIPQYKDESGIYMYEDINKISYNTEEFFLGEVECLEKYPAEFL